MRGWTFDVDTVALSPKEPWDYVSRAREIVSGAGSVIDMGTGGGERFSQICEDYEGLAVATESWAPNVRVSADRLMPQSIAVVHASSMRLPFGDNSFDVVLDRHEELDPAEVARVLSPAGRVLTQQVHDNWRELKRFFPRMTDFGDHFRSYKEGFRSHGLTIILAQTHDTEVAYGSLGDIVYLLAATPWTVPGFDLEQDLDALLALERNSSRPEGIVLTEGRYILEAFKPLS